MDLQTLEVRHRGELTGAFAALTGWRAGAVLAPGDPVIGMDLVRPRCSAGPTRPSSRPVI
jgi:hypothetical protein